MNSHEPLRLEAVTRSVTNSTPKSESIITVAIGRCAVAAAPTRLRTLLGSCVGVVLYDRVARAGGIAHILLPDSQGLAEADHLGKYADTAIPALLAELERLVAARARARLTAKLLGGATMFPANQAQGIGERNQQAVEQVLATLGITIVARDLGGQVGRRVTLDTERGVVSVKIPGGAEYEI
jgi:chemotaxis protein CheD